MRKLLTILLTLVLSSISATAATIRVPADQPTIQAGIDAASNGDTVLVADGTYTGVGNRDIQLRGEAITLRSENGPENCIIDTQGTAEEPHLGILIYQYESRNTIVDGLTITGAYGVGIAGPYGVGIQVTDASPVIRNCILSGNYKGLELWGGYALVESTRVVLNTWRGISSWGNAHIVNSVIRDNGGSGLYCTGDELISNCLIAGNSTTGPGGGIYCTLYGYPTFRNCTIVNNTAAWGGGLAIISSNPTLENCILAGNSANRGDQYAIVMDYYGYGSSLTISYSDVAGETYVEPGCNLYTGPGMIDEDPLFVSGPLGDYYLSQVVAGQGADSPCVDAGTPDGEMIHGTTRTDSVQDADRVDMGYHYRDPAEDHLPETVILSGPDMDEHVSTPVVVFTFTGIDWEYPASALIYSWRFNDEPWSDWSPRTWGATSGLEGQIQNISFDVRARDPEGDVDPSPATRIFHHEDWTNSSKFARFVVGPGSGSGNPPLVRTGQGQWTAYSVMRYGVNVAAGDIDGDGADEVITGPGPGDVFGPHVRCFQPDGTPVPNAEFLAYGTHKYGVKVASGDVDGDGYDEIITGAGPGAVFGPHIRGWNWDGGTGIAPIPGISFIAYGTNKYGVNVACGDIDGDGTDEIISGAGPGAVFGPHVRGWRFGGGGTSPMGNVSFFAFGTPRWGVNVACGDLDGDGIDEIITGAGPGPSFSPHVRAWDYDGTEIAQMPGISFFAYPNLLHGAVVGAADVDEDGLDELLTMPGPGPSNLAWLRAWDVESGGVELDDENWNFNAFDTWMTHGGRLAGSKNGWE